MMLFEKCPIRGVGMGKKKVRAEVCLHCGERLYSQETVRRFEEIRGKLERQETADFETLGVSFQVV